MFLRIILHFLNKHY